MLTEQSQRCPICRKLYKVFSMYCGDQSKCPGCREVERETLERADTPKEIERRRRFFR